eukprot:m51a1_g1231 putative camk camk1 protein kinase (1513) ;mRNA; f:532582-538988
MATTFAHKNEAVQNDYTMGPELGSGAFSKVYSAVCKQTGEKRAVKVISKNGLVKQVLLVENEIKCWSRLRHPSVVALYEVYETSESYAFVQELVTGGELFDRIVENQYYSEADASGMLRQITEGVLHCHKSGVIHRDLKPENLLCSDPTPRARVLIADFGLAAMSEDERRLRKPVGTPGYIAPEVLETIDDEKARPAGPESDVWSLGVILYVLLCGFPPFDIEDEQKGMEEALVASYSFPHDSAWDDISDTAKGLIKSILVVDPKKRPTAQQILDHPWVKQTVAGRNKPLQKTIEQMVKFNARRKWKVAIRATLEDRFVDYFVVCGADVGSVDPGPSPPASQPWCFSRPIKPLVTSRYPPADRPSEPPVYQQAEARAKAGTQALPPVQCYAPTCMCVLSRRPMFSAFRDVLLAVYRMAHEGATEVPVERWVSCVVDDVPLPCPGGTVVVRPPRGAEVLVKVPWVLDFPQLDFSVTSLFDRMGVDNVVTIFDCMLQECKIVFTSRQLSLLNSVAEVATSFMYPFKWPHIYIPVLSLQLMEFLQAPMTFMVGLPRSHEGPICLPKETVEAPDLLLVDLDGGRLRKGSGVKQFIPEPLRTWLVDNLSRSLMRTMDMAWPLNDPMNWADFGLENGQEAQEPSVEVQVRAVFLGFWTMIMKPYRKLIQYVRKYPKPIVSCYKMGLKKKHPPYLSNFVERFTESQTFVSYVERFGFQTPTLFDLAVFNAVHLQDSSLEFVMNCKNKPKDVVVYEVPPPDASGLPAVPLPNCFEEKEELVGICGQDEYKDPKQLEDEQRETLFIDTCLETIMASQPLADQEKSLFSGILALPHGGLSVANRLADYVQKRNDVPLDQTAFDSVAALVRRIVSDCTESGDFRAPAQLVRILGNCYSNIDGIPTFLYSTTTGFELWRNMDFWEFAHWNEVQEKRDELDPRYRSTVDDYAELSPEVQKESVEAEESLLFEVTSNTARNMLVVGVPESQVQGFVSRLASAADLSADSAVTLVHLAANLSKVHTASAPEAPVKPPSPSPGRSRSVSFTVRKMQSTPVDPKVLYAQLMEHSKASPSITPAPAELQAPPIVLQQKLMVMQPQPQHHQRRVSWPNWAAASATIDCGDGTVDFADAIGSTVVCCCASGHLQTWDSQAAPPKLVARVRAHAEHVTAMRIIGSSITTASIDQSVRMWDVGDDGSLVPQEHLKLGDPALSMEARGGVIAVGTKSGAVVAINVGRPSVVAGRLVGHKSPVRAVGMCFGGSDGRLLVVSGSDDGAVKVWDALKHSLLHSFSCKSPVIFMSAHGKFAISGDERGRAMVWDLCGGPRRAKMRLQSGSMASMAFQHTTGRVACGTTGGDIEVWDTATGTLVARLHGHQGQVGCLCCSDDGALLASGSADNCLRIWDLSTLQCSRTMRGVHSSEVRSVRVCEGRVISAARDGQIKLTPLYSDSEYNGNVSQTPTSSAGSPRSSTPPSGFMSPLGQRRNSLVPAAPPPVASPHIDMHALGAKQPRAAVPSGSLFKRFLN